jgi:hypothetical protein
MKTSFFFKNTCLGSPKPLAFAIAVGISLSSSPASAVQFNFIGTDTLAPSYRDKVVNGFNQAAFQWSSLLADDVTVNIGIDFKPAGLGFIADTQLRDKFVVFKPYTEVRNALEARAQTDDAKTAVANLPKGSSLELLLNTTQENPNVPAAQNPYLDNNGSANNTTISLTPANAKALGLLAANSPALDATITFNSDFNFIFPDGTTTKPIEFSPQDDLIAQELTNPRNFVDIVTHELGHVLGFISNEEKIDENIIFQPEDTQNYFPTTLDLFRHSTDSLAYGKGVIDMRVGCTNLIPCDQYFSLDGGTTKIASFSTGVIFGDGGQPSHWKESMLTGIDLGIMNPTLDGVLDPATGELIGSLEPRQFSQYDKQAFNAIGWNLKQPVSVPEPRSLVGLTAFGAGLLLTRKNRHRKITFPIK